jgi:hypothetical protein
MTWTLRTRAGREFGYGPEGLEPSPDAAELMAWARAESPVAVTPTGPFVEADPPPDEVAVWWLALMFVDALGDTVEARTPPPEAESFLQEPETPPDAIF